MEIDRKAFHQLTYGLFLLSAQFDGVDNGCIVNTVAQVASDPRQISVSCIKGNLTQEMIEKTGQFNVSVLDDGTDLTFFERFGMVSGREGQKFTEKELQVRLENGLVYSADANAVFACKVTQSMDLGSHVMYVADVVEAQKLSGGNSITYARYLEAKRAAKPALKQEEQSAPVAWKCDVCGYIYEGEVLPSDFICPLCKHGVEDFSPVFAETENKVIASEEGAANNDEGVTMAKWVCKVCGYIYEGENPPEECPVCHVPATMFEKVEGEMKLAAEHEFGIYEKTVKNNENVSDEDKAYILEQLKANFVGECSEVGMYLCMARIAHREGYPEIGLYWEKAAYEEAEHAAKFAELLGEECEPQMTASTKKNLAWRVDCEFGATQGKVELATCAKKNGLDAIHDTVHEMARDEARHGKALKGLLERYFG